MEKKRAISMLAALAHEGRLDLFRLLVRRAPDEAAAGEIAAALGVRSTTLSNQLDRLEREGLIRSRREGRSILYAADIERAGEVLGYLAADCCRGKPEACAPAAAPFLRRVQRGREQMKVESGVFKVLFLCTHNSARSIMGEVILNRLAPGRFKAYSAGSTPREAVHPNTLTLLEGLNYDVSSLRSKDWKEFSTAGAPALDFVFTVCDRAANEPCPAWPGQPMTAHWSVEDPSAYQGGETERAVAFAEAYRHLHNRLAAFTALPLETLDSLSLQKRLDEIGRMPAPVRGTASVNNRREQGATWRD